MRFGLPILLGAIGLAGCSGDVTFTPVPGNGSFDPAEVDFGVRAVFDVHSEEINFRNTQGRPITVSEIDFRPSSDVFNLTRLGGETVRGLTVRPNQMVPMTVTFAPPAEETFETTLWLRFEGIEIPLVLKGEARQIAPARPSVAPESMTFDNVPRGGTLSRSATLFNLGDEPGDFSAVLVDDEFEVQAAGGLPLDLPITIQPRDSIPINVLYKPRDESADSTNITFRFSNSRTANLTVNGNPSPESALTCVPERVEFGAAPRGEVRRETVTCSANPMGWSLKEIRTAPGSDSVFSLDNLPSGLDANGQLSFDVVFTSAGPSRVYDGLFEIVTPFEVVTQVGASGEATAPPAGNADVWLSLAWDTIDTDIDLHFVRDNSSPFSAADDCFFEFRNPDWGVPSLIFDNPVLDRDDKDGFGPELLDLALAPDGVYDVYAQYYKYMGHPSVPAVQVDVSYELRNGATGTHRRIFTTCGQMWHVGRITKAGSNLSFALLDTMDDIRWLPNAQCP